MIQEIELNLRRHSSPTRRRMELTVELLQQFLEAANRTLAQSEIQTILGFSPSGARKYTKDLKERRLVSVQLVSHGGGGRGGAKVTANEPLYTLTDDHELVDAYMKSLKTAIEAGTYSPSREAKNDPGQDRAAIYAAQGRSFHILADDAHYAIRVNRSPVTRDPLVAALFGPPISTAAIE